MAYTEIQIANMALAKLGNTARPLTGTTIAGLPITGDPTYRLAAQQVTAFYAFSRDWVLRDYPWGFAMDLVQTTVLRQASEAVAWNGRWLYEYRYPTAALLIRAVRYLGEARDNPKPNAWEVSSDTTDRVVRTNVGTEIEDPDDADETLIVANFEYTKNSTPVGVYSDDAKFVAALVSRLAFDIAPGMNADIGKAQAAWNLSRAEILSGQRSDANEDSQEPEPDGDFVTAHRRG